MSENQKPTENQSEADEKSSEELSDKALAEVSGGVIAIIRPTEQISESVLVSTGLQDDAIHFKYDIKGNKEG